MITIQFKQFRVLTQRDISLMIVHYLQINGINNRKFTPGGHNQKLIIVPHPSKLNNFILDDFPLDFDFLRNFLKQIDVAIFAAHVNVHEVGVDFAAGEGDWEVGLLVVELLLEGF
jgi:hypothetical protein